MKYLRDPRELSTEERINPYETKPLMMFGSQELNRYRRRRLPIFMLQGEHGDYPVFASMSSLSIAFA